MAEVHSGKPGYYVAFLLLLLAVLMGFHMILLQTGLNECDAWSQVLLERLKRSPIGSLQSEKLRNELRDYLNGKQSECAAAEEVFEKAADKYLSVILALLTGAGVAAGTTRGLEIAKRRADEDKRSSPPDKPPTEP